jgi:phytoene dehydrogenase-like protein
VRPETTIFAPSVDGRALIPLARSGRRRRRRWRPGRRRDAERWPEFQAATDDIARVLDRLMRLVPPSIDRPSPAELWDLLRLGKDIRGLGRERLYQVLRWGPMAVADFAAEWCETPLLRAVVAARGTFGANAGPWSAGTTLGWMLQATAERHPAGAPSFVVGGPGSLAAALAVVATSAGAAIRTNASVARIEVDDTGVTAVVLESGESIATDTVLSNADPKRTLLGLVDPMRLTPSFLQQIRNYRMSGVTATVNLALDGLPAFTALAKSNVAAETALAGRIHIGPDVDYIERAFDCSKYGRLSDRPWLEAVIPSLSTPRWRRPAST